MTPVHSAFVLGIAFGWSLAVLTLWIARIVRRELLFWRSVDRELREIGGGRLPR